MYWLLIRNRYWNREVWVFYQLRIMKTAEFEHLCIPKPFKLIRTPAMKTQRLLALLAILSLVFIYIACQRDNFGPIPPPPSDGKIQTSVSGRVLDDENLPVMGAVVKAGNLSTNTDLNGYFEIRNTTLNANAGFVKVEKAGFFAGSRTFKAIKGSKQYVSIQLIKKNDAGNFNSAAGGTITVPNGGSIVFDAGSVIDPATSTAYTGTVNVSAFWLDPTKDNFKEIMPGELRGIDENNKEVGLQSFGMMTVEMTGAGGEKLQLAPGKPATIKFPIAAAQQATAPATIAFWSFNDTTGLWKQEGMATKHGSEYAGKTSHFSFWNCDAPFALVDFKATLKDQDGNPLKQVRVDIKTADDVNGPQASSYTDTNGVVAGLVPSGKKLNFIVTGKCKNTLLLKEIGPLSAATDLGIVNVTIPPDSKVTFTGEIKTCDGSTNVNGYVDIGILGAFERAPIINGVLNYSFIRCGINDTKASYRITDAGNNIVGGLQEINITGNQGALGRINVCDNNLTEYFEYQLDTIRIQNLPPAQDVYIEKTDTAFHSYYYNQADTTRSYELYFALGGPNETVSSFSLRILTNKGYYSNAPSLTFQITERGEIGEYMSGIFNGKMTSMNNAALPERTINGRFRLKRKK